MKKVDRRVAKTQELIKKAFLELMNEKKFETITIQDISDRANVNRSTIYLHYLDKYDLLDKLIDQHINKLTEMNVWACDEEWLDATLIFVKYFEDNSLFFSTMLASKAAAPSFRSKFIKYAKDGFKEEFKKSNVNNEGLSEDYCGICFKCICRCIGDMDKGRNNFIFSVISKGFGDFDGEDSIGFLQLLSLNSHVNLLQIK